MDALVILSQSAGSLDISFAPVIGFLICNANGIAANACFNSPVECIRSEDSHDAYIQDSCSGADSVGESPVTGIIIRMPYPLILSAYFNIASFALIALIADFAARFDAG
jgi:hypothetical protein